MTETKKHYQGQKGCNPRSLCPKCNAILKNAYIREAIPGTEKKTFKVIGLACPDCDHIERTKLEE